MLNATLKSRSELIWALTSKERLLFPLGRYGQLTRSGLIVPEHDLEKWDDEYNEPIRNGHDRTPLHFMFDMLQHLTSSKDEYRRIVWIYGDPRAGKTMLARIVTVHLCALLDVDGAYFNWPEQLAAMQDSYGDQQRHVDMTLAHSASVLVLDDVGQERGTLWELTKLYNLLENRAHKRLTIITSNLALKHARKGKDALGGKLTYPAYLKKISQPMRSETDADVPVVAARIGSRLQTDRYLLATVPMTRRDT